MREIKYHQFDKISKFIDYRGKTPNKTDNGIPLITAKNVKFGYLAEEPKEYISIDDYDDWMSRGIPKKGDILFTTEAPLGNVCILNTDEKRAFAQRTIILQPINDGTYDSTFLFYYLMSQQFMNELDSKKTGTTVYGIKSSILKKFQIPLPELPEQQRIVSKLNLLFQKIDKSIELHQKNMDEADAFMGSVLNEVFGELEEKYQTEILKNILEKAQYGFSDKSSDDGMYPFLRMGDLQNGKVLLNNLKYVNLSKTDFLKYKLDKYDLLFNRTNSFELVGKTSIYENDMDMTFASYLVRLKVKQEKIIPYFLNYFLNAKNTQNTLKEMATKAINQSNINAQKLQSISIPLPPLSIQQKVVEYLDSVSEKIEKVKSIQKEKMENLKALKASILDRAFRGEL